MIQKKKITHRKNKHSRVNKAFSHTQNKIGVRTNSVIHTWNLRNER